MKRRKLIIAAGIAVVLIIVILITAIMNRRETVYRESEAVKGNLTVGITNDTTLTVEESAQTFDVDISEYSSDSSDYSWSSQSGGMSNPFQGMAQIMSGSASTDTQSSSSTRKLTVVDVLVKVGEEIKEGDPICNLDETSVTSIRNELLADETKAQNTLSEKNTDAELKNLSATQELATNQTYGTYAQTYYNITVSKYAQAVTDAETKLAEQQQKLTEQQEELTEKQTLLAENQKVLENAEYVKAGTDQNSSLYYWLEAENTRDDAKSTVDSLTKEIETLTDEIETSTETVNTLTGELETAKKESETKAAEAKADYDKQILYYNNAQQIYDTATSESTLYQEEAQTDYDDAKQKLDDFDSNVINNQLVAKSSGVISAIDIAAGDSIYSDGQVLTFNNYDNVTAVVTLNESEVSTIEKGTQANITLSAYDDQVFTGSVTTIGEAQYDSDTATNNYDVTVTLSGIEDKIFDGMSAQVTLVTKEIEEVIYVPNRSIIRSGTKSYVKVKTSKCSISKKEVTTGFSDGINVEIKSGIEEGETVLIESGVKSE